MKLYRSSAQVAPTTPITTDHGAEKQVCFWIIIAFCFLRSAEVLVLQKPLPYIQYLVTVSGATYFFSLLRSATSLARVKFSLNLQVSLLLFSIMVSSFLLQAVFYLNPPDSFGRRPQHMLLQQIFLAVSWFFSGSAATACRTVGKSWLNVSLIFVLFAFVVYATNFGLSIPYADLQDEGGFLTLNHLLLSEYMLFICFLSYVSSPALFRPLVLLMTTYILFAGGGRSSLLIGIGSLLVYEYLFSGRSTAIACATIIALGAGAALYYVDLRDPVIQYMLFSAGVENDASSVLRSEQFSAGLERLPNQVFFGEASFLVTRFNDLGYYMHNIISAWQLFGAAVFFMLIWFLMRSVCRMMVIMRHGATGVDHFFAAVFIYASISALTVKYVGFSALWYVLGYWMLRRDIRRRVINRSFSSFS